MVVLNDLFERKKIKDYMTMLGIEIPDLRKFGDYKQSDQYLRMVLNGKRDLTPKARDDIYRAISIAYSYLANHRLEVASEKKEAKRISVERSHEARRQNEAKKRERKAKREEKKKNAKTTKWLLCL